MHAITMQARTVMTTLLVVAIAVCMAVAVGSHRLSAGTAQHAAASAATAGVAADPDGLPWG